VRGQYYTCEGMPPRNAAHLVIDTIHGTGLETAYALSLTQCKNLRATRVLREVGGKARLSTVAMGEREG
jgi:hypothetical protein